MKNKYLRLKLAVRRIQKAKELEEKEKANRLTQEQENVILKTRQREWALINQTKKNKFLKQNSWLKKNIML